MKRTIVSLFLTTSIIACQTMQNENNEKAKTSSKYTQPKETLELNIDTIDVSEYISNYLLIGKEESLVSNGIKTVLIKDYIQYKLNDSAQVVLESDESDVYVEFKYNDNGMLVNAIHRLHSIPESRGECIRVYSESGVLKKIINIESGTPSIPNSIDTITDPNELAEFKNPYKRALDFNTYYNDTLSQRILTYRNTLAFRSGVMIGKNELSYYINASGLIDSLVIIGIDNDMKMTFEYEYE